MITGEDTTQDWQVHAGHVVVGAVGSFEQHGAHLPLVTDTRVGDSIARTLAEGLDAALLPSLPFGTCFEHSGFRGSISLKPETLMQTIRDLADELERQHFTRWILVNAHGGNYCLGPVVRDINRMDRPLKILLLDWSGFADPSIASDHADRGWEIHAGEMETSVALALIPELVRPGGVDMPSHTEEALPLAQKDLNTFGLGRLAPDGAAGWPSLARREKGDRILASVYSGMLAHVRDRLRRLDEQPRYSGAGGLALRRMTVNDLPAVMRLTRLAGWNQTEADWRIFLDLHPDGCRVAVRNGAVIGSVAAIGYGDGCGWISMVLVDPDYRRMGIATRLVDAAAQTLSSCACIRLDATPAGRPVYERMGFEDAFGIRRMVARTLPDVAPPSGVPVTPLTVEDMAQAVSWDAGGIGGDRAGLLERLRERAPDLAWKICRKGDVHAFCLGRPGAHAFQAGPVYARNLDDAKAVAAAAFVRLRGCTVMMDVPVAHTDMLDWLADLGFRAERDFVRMVRGSDAHPDEGAKGFAIAGPEFG